jgi:hypothetical protein
VIAPNEASCPSCGYALHSVGAVNPDTHCMCESGDVSVCPRCGCHLLYDESGVREFTASELLGLQASQLHCLL